MALEVDFDDALAEIGEFGRYQKLLFILFALPVTVMDGIASYVNLFLGATPPHWCRSRNLEEHLKNSTLKPTLEQLQNLTVPPSERALGAGCHIYDVDFVMELEKTAGKFWPNESWPVRECPPEGPFGYDTSDYKSTIVTEWDLVCAKDWMPSLILTMAIVGSVVGTFVFGIVNDKWGRRKSFFLSWLVITVPSVLTRWCPEYVSYTVARTLVGLALTPVYQIAFVLVMELVGPTKRTLISQGIAIFYSFGYMGLALMAYVFSDWKDLSIASGIPWAVFIVYWWFLPESPRWLITHGKFEEAEELVQKMAKVNGVDIPKNYLFTLKKKADDDDTTTEEDDTPISTVTSSRESHIGVYRRKSGSPKALAEHRSSLANLGPNAPTLKVSTADALAISPGRRMSVVSITSLATEIAEDDFENAPMYDLVKTLPMRKLFLLITFNWIADVVVYDGLSYMTTSLDVNAFIAFFISGAVELVAYILCWLIVDRAGRKWPLIISMFIAGAALFVAAFIPSRTPNKEWIVAGTAMVGKLGISFAYTLIYLYAGELFPTTLRGRGMSLASNIAHIVDVGTPYVVYLRQYGASIPMLIFGGLSVAGGMSMWFLPETLNKHLPETKEDAEELMKEGPEFSLNAMLSPCRDFSKTDIEKEKPRPSTGSEDDKYMTSRDSVTRTQDGQNSMQLTTSKNNVDVQNASPPSIKQLDDSYAQTSAL